MSTHNKSALEISQSCFTSSPAGCEKVVFSEHGHFDQEGRTVQTFAIKRSVAIIRELAAYVPETPIQDIKFIGHQANLSMLDFVCKRAGITPDNHFFNVDIFGNCGAAGAPTDLSQHWKNFKQGDVIVLAVVGSGLSWGGVLINVS